MITRNEILVRLMDNFLIDLGQDGDLAGCYVEDPNERWEGENLTIYGTLLTTDSDGNDVEWPAEIAVEICHDPGDFESDDPRDWPREISWELLEGPTLRV